MKLLVNNPPRLKADYLLISVMDYDVASGDDRMGRWSCRTDSAHYAGLWVLL